MADTSRVNLTIEGRPVAVPAGTNLIEAAKQAGVLIPHYCYHPGLPVAGVCRMCLVEVEKAPKLAPACATAVAEGQVVHVHSEKAREARKGVLEMLLINHPLDCPICDQSGECELQDYTYQEGRADSRYREPKRFNPVEDFGGDVVYVTSRCILCTRCVRFMDDVAHDAVLNVSERGDRATIGKFEGKDLTNPWAANVVDLCPVGALLSKDFLHKARAWELDRTASVCTGCSQGCNIIVETRDNVVMRVRPRSNESVNQFFMCDEGRFGYRKFNAPSRLEAPSILGPRGHEAVDWDIALEAAARVLRGKRAFVVASPNLSNETLYLLGRLMKKFSGVGTYRVARGPEAPLPGVDDLALRADRAANPRGADLLGFSRSDTPFAGLAAGDALVLADHELTDADLAAVSRASAVIVLATAMPQGLPRADVVLPIATTVEEEGTFTNLRGRVQRFLQAKAAPGLARPSWFVMSDLLGATGETTTYFTASDVFEGLATSHDAFRGLTYDTLGVRGLPIAGAMAGASA
ncbi:MAG: (2Fe-2S)-binding protein [Gemmatimonadaceae bacterium]|nr:(2Fe-2S)-binding protein [Gemmatimonadaceae bacterium]